MNHQIVPLQPGLYLVATPIGTARDITLRALDILASVDILVAEDTRSLKKLLAIHGVPLGNRPVWSYHDHSGAGSRDSIAREITSGRSVAYASEAGTPMMSDPGFELARAVRRAGSAVTTAPGPVAAIAALTLAGLPTDRFMFLGFLPNKTVARQKALHDVAEVPATLVMYESPRRVQGLLDDLVSCLGREREAALCRELTKRFEEICRAPLAELAAMLADRTLKGECVLVVGPPRPVPVSLSGVATALEEALQTLSVKDASTEIAARFGLSRKEVYQMALAQEKTDDGNDV